MKQANVPGRILRPVICSSSLFAGWSQKPRPPTCCPSAQPLHHTPAWLAHLAISEATEELLGPSLEKKGEVGTNGVLGGCAGA